MSSMSFMSWEWGMEKIGAIIPAGGIGKRMQAGVPKQFLTIKGKPIFIITLELICSIKEISEIVIVYPLGEEKTIKDIILKFNLDKKIKTMVCGGMRRQDSVKNGVLSLSNDIEYAFIHDAVRPYVKKECIQNLIKEINKNDCVILAKKIVETVKKVSEKKEVLETLDRNSLYAVQTPQIFKKEILNMCYKKDYFDKIEYTDESMMVEMEGYKVKVIEGNAENIKITEPYDLRIAEAME